MKTVKKINSYELSFSDEFNDQDKYKIEEILKQFNFEYDKQIIMDNKQFEKFKKNIKIYFNDLNFSVLHENIETFKYNSKQILMSRNNMIINENEKSKYVDWNTFNNFKNEVGLRFDKLEKRMDFLEQRMDKLEIKISEIEVQVDKIGTMVIKVLNILEKHSKILQNLK